jgi:hypothetical protein
MEDLAFSRKLRSLGAVRTIPFRVVVSGRRLIERPLYYALLINLIPSAVSARRAGERTRGLVWPCSRSGTSYFRFR